MKDLFESRLAKKHFVIKESNTKKKHLMKSSEAKLNFMKIYGDFVPDGNDGIGLSFSALNKHVQGGKFGTVERFERQKNLLPYQKEINQF